MRPVAATFGALVLLALAACGGGPTSADDPPQSPPESNAGETDTGEAPKATPIDPAVVGDAGDFRRRVAQTIPIDGEPDFLVVDFGSVWVGNFGTETLDRIDPKTGKVVKRIPVGSPCGSMSSGFGSVWLLSCGGLPEIVRVDPRRNRVAARIEVTENLGEAGIGVGERGAWSMTSAEGELALVDPAENAIATTYTIGEGSTVVVAGLGSVWVAESNANAVQRVDEASGEVLATIPVGLAPRFMAVGEGSVWVITQGDGDVYRIDPRTNEVVAVIDVGEAFQGGDIKAGLGTVWAATGEGPLSRIDPATNEVVEHYESNGADAIGIGANAVWITDHQAKTLYKLSPTP